MVNECVRVHILDVPYHADREYDYFVPEYLRDGIKIGSMVIVPFGKANRQKLALVVALSDCLNERGSLKNVISVMNEYISLDDEMLGLCEFMKSNTLCTCGDAVKCMLPTSVVSKVRELYTLTDKSESAPLENISQLYEYIKANPSSDIKKIKEKFKDADYGISFLLKNKYLKKEVVIDEKDGSKYENIVSLKISAEDALALCDSKKLRSEKHKEILRLLCEYPSLSDKDIYERTGTQRTQLNALCEKELIKIEKVPVMRDKYLSVRKEKEELKLSKEQEKAFQQLKSLYNENAPRAALLYGVTGSGKTSVMKMMIDEVIKSGKSVIILVPEISLTPQTVSVFCGYYGDRVAVIHSNLSAGERFDSYKKIKDSMVDIVIGTRSAVFAPLKNLGMIIIDEEQEHTYKSETSPKYLAHDIARYRCAKNNALMLLASATPSLTSYYKAMSGKYALVKLSERYGGATLPSVIITDMRKERALGNMSAFGTKLARLVSDALEEKKQSILFLNRRGYHSSLGCQNCGKTIECPHCSVALTYHAYKKIDTEITAENAYDIMSKSGVLRCHYCGYQTRVSEKCPSCGEGYFDYIGIGTQKLENDISLLFENCRTLRMDADTTSTKSSYENILGSFLNGEADVLIGTQMVTKGHNFPKVTVVGVMLADTMLYTSDYRASERTFSMLTQVIGRAGRAKDKGIAVIQTNSPNDTTIQFAAEQNYDAFYKNEIQIRKSYLFPPFCDIAVLTASSESENCVNECVNGVMEMIKKYFNEDLAAIVYGPFEAPIYKAQGKYRKRIIVKCRLIKELRDIFARILCESAKSFDKARLSIDFNPSTL
ncbi:MAG: primosomal protein N' [Clostridia bacterium]|nr:primosomal protein N' [Clostridia bacterium]